MAKKLIICAHGVGDHQKDFYTSWEEVLVRNHDADRFKVVGLHWDDIQDELYDKFFDLPEELQALAEDTFLENVYMYLDNPDNEHLVAFLKENAFDAASYLLLKEFRNAILWPKCMVRLLELINAHKTYQPVLIGHSLGSVMLTHTSWFIRQETGSLKYHDFFLIGSPIGLRSPVQLIPDFLNLLADVGNHASRLDALSIWAGEWYHPRRNRLHIIINENDPIAWDVKAAIEVEGVLMDLDIIPIRQGLDAKEIKRIEEANPETVKRFTEGDNALSELIGNHDALMYLDSDPFKSAFDAML